MYLREFGRDSGGLPAAELTALLSNLPAIATDPYAQFVLGRFLHGRRQYRQAAEKLAASLSADAPQAFTAEATWLLGESALKVARKSGLRDRPDAATLWRDRGLAALREVEAGHPESEYADDAALLRIETEFREAETEPDTALARRKIAVYSEFKTAYPNSDRLDRALLAMADAMRTLGGTEPAWIDTALTTYRGIRRAYPKRPAAERATYGIGLCQGLKQDYVAAEETLRDFLFEFPRSDLESHARFQLGRILLDRGFPRSAADDLTELLAGPAPPELARSARDLLAESYFRAGDYRRAIHVDAELLSLGPDGPLMARLARSYEANGQAAEAVETCKALLDAFPNVAYADSFAYARARLLAGLERHADAVSAFKAFPKRYPESPAQSRSGQDPRLPPVRNRGLPGRARGPSRRFRLTPATRRLPRGKSSACTGSNGCRRRRRHRADSRRLTRTTATGSPGSGLKRADIIRGPEISRKPARFSRASSGTTPAERPRPRPPGIASGR